jgi:hypothetical protein
MPAVRDLLSSAATSARSHGGPWLPTLALIGAVGLWQGGRLAAERVSPPRSQDPLWISESRLDDGRRLLVVVDQGTRHAAVYHVDAAAGTLTLKSTRDISWDLMVGDFNAQEPRPGALQKMLQLPAAPPR